MPAKADISTACMSWKSQKFISVGDGSKVESGK
jgi:hypothetical protein